LLVMPDCACAARLCCHICSRWPCRTGRAHLARLRALPCPMLSHTAALLARACTRSAWPRGLCPLCSAMPPCLLTLSVLGRAAMSARAGHVRSRGCCSAAPSPLCRTQGAAVQHSDPVRKPSSVCRTHHHAAGYRCRARRDKGRVAIKQAAAAAAAAAEKRAFATVGVRALPSMVLSMARWKPASRHAAIHGEEQVVRCSICGELAVAWPLGSIGLSVARSCSLVVHAQNNGLRREKAIKK
jgi:hypothetical protein